MTCWYASATCSRSATCTTSPGTRCAEQRFWHVTGNFPRITEADLRPGVGDCRYRISTAGLDQYLMTADQVSAIIGGSRDE